MSGRDQSLLSMCRELAAAGEQASLGRGAADRPAAARLDHGPSRRRRDSAGPDGSAPRLFPDKESNEESNEG